MTHPIYSVTLFPSQLSTLPSAQHVGLSPAQIGALVAPSHGPYEVREKRRAVHYLTCPLQAARYVGETAKRFPAEAIGKQRSASHVTESAWFAFDLDDIAQNDRDAILKRMRNCTYVAYSTHSHGKEAGLVRMRVLLFIDRTLGPVEWGSVWAVLNCMVFEGRADTATAKMHQAASVWAAHPDRASHVFRRENSGRVFSAARLLAKVAPRPALKALPAQFAPKHANESKRFEEALAWVPSTDYRTWLLGLCGLRAAVALGKLSEPDGRGLWLRWTASAGAANQVNNNQAAYSPDVMWGRCNSFTAAPAVLVASIFSKAKSAALSIVEHERQKPSLSPRGRSAAQYLAKFHHETFQQLTQMQDHASAQ